MASNDSDISHLVAAQPGDRSHDQFRAFFPGWDTALQGYLDGVCRTWAQEYFDPKNTNRGSTYGLIECMLEQFPEFRKAEMATTSVVLGLVPTIIQQLGVSTTETSLLSLSHPVLTLLLSLASPVVLPRQSGQYLKDISSWTTKSQPITGYQPETQLTKVTFRKRGAVILGPLSYLVAFGAVLNIAHLTYQLGYQAICIFAVGETYMATLWTVLALLVHGAGVLALHMRFNVQRFPTGSSPRGLWGRLLRCFGDEFGWTDTQGWGLELETDHDASIGFSIFTRVLYLCITVHLAFGTIVQASLVFVSALDSIGILARYIASTVCCRVILEFKLTQV